MARRFDNGKILTFRPDRGWVRVINGKRVRFGPKNPKKSDREAYRQAVKEYLAYIQEADQLSDLQAEAKARGLADEHFLESLADPNVRKLKLPKAWLHDVDAQDNDPYLKFLAEKVAEKDDASAASSSKNGDAIAITDLLDAYITEQRKRRTITEAAPNALPRKKRLSYNGWRGLKDVVESFRKWVEAHARVKSFGDTAQMEGVLSDYRNWLDGQLIKGKYAPQTISNKVKGLRPLVKWLWQNRHIADLPRNLDAVCAQYQAERNAKPLNAKQIKAIWKAAKNEMKSRIAMSLNCALYSKELAVIKVGDIRDGYYAGRRPKTGVAGRFKLWRVTQDLIAPKLKRRNPDKFLFVTEKGAPIATETTDSNADAFRELRDGAGLPDVVWNQFRDTTATLVEKIGKRTGDKALVSDLLRHADGRVAKFYIDPNLDPHSIVNEPLDKALTELESHYDLKLSVTVTPG